MALMESPTNRSLMDQLSNFKNEEAWRRFVDIYTPFIDRYLGRWGLQPADLEEVRSRVLTKIIGALKSFRYDPTKRFRGYLCEVIRNTLISYRLELKGPGFVGSGYSWTYAQASRCELPEDLETLSSELEGRVYESLQTWHRIQLAARARVSENTWEAFERVFLQGQAVMHVAEDLGMSRSAVCMARARVLAILKEMGRTFDEERTA